MHSVKMLAQVSPGKERREKEGEIRTLTIEHSD